MIKEKKNTDSNRNEKPNIRSSAAEYLSFVAAGGGSEEAVEMRYEDENIWLTQKLMAELYGVSVPAINQHLKRIFGDNELSKEATIKKYLIVQSEGQRQVQRYHGLPEVIRVDNGTPLTKVELSGCHIPNSAKHSPKSRGPLDNLNPIEIHIHMP
jgi:hypothetical protein